jgi:hypothetical protein
LVYFLMVETHQKNHQMLFMILHGLTTLKSGFLYPKLQLCHI